MKLALGPSPIAPLDREEMRQMSPEINENDTRSKAKVKFSLTVDKKGTVPSVLFTAMVISSRLSPRSGSGMSCSILYLTAVTWWPRATVE